MTAVDAPPPLTSGSLAPAALAGPGGTFAMVAMDQRESLRGMLAERGRADSDEAMTAFELAVARELGGAASAFLIDREYGYDRVVADRLLPDGCALVLAADELAYQRPGVVADTGAWLNSGGRRPPVDPGLADRRARAAALLLLALPGAAYVYQGEELGLPEVPDLPDDVLKDPVRWRSGGERKGRDGCRVPLPWTASGPSFGFGPAAGWPPQPPEWAALSVAEQSGDSGSMLELYRAALRLRRANGGDGALTWTSVADRADVLAFRRDTGLLCVINLGTGPVPLPEGEVLLSSGPLPGSALPAEGAVRLATGDRG